MAKIIFPKPLPELNKENETNEMGFTASEILTLQNVWTLVKQQAKYHASNVFLSLYTENDFLIERFRDPITGKFNLSSLHQHPEKMLHAFCHIVEHSLHNVGYFHAVMEDVRTVHKQRNVTCADIELHVNFLTNYVIKYFWNKKSHTLETALKKFANMLIEQHRELDEEELIINGNQQEEVVQ